jgi:hypothetical protein
MVVTRTFTDRFMDRSNAMADALAGAGRVLDQPTRLGGCARDPTRLRHEAGCPRVMLALMRARRWGFEEGVFAYAARRAYVLPPEGEALGERPWADRPGSEDT